MLSLRLETIRGSFLTEYSGILKDFGLDISGLGLKMYFPQRVKFDVGSGREF